MSRPAIAARPSTARRDGFTLVELLVIVGIIGVLLAIGIPALQQQIVRSKLEGVARETSSMMVGARFQAIKTGDPALVQIDTATGEILSFVDSDEDGAYTTTNDRLLRTTTLTAGITLEGPGSDPNAIDGFVEVGTVGTAQFDPDGSATENGAFRFADTERGNYLEVRVAPRASARIEIQKWDEDEGEFLAQGEKGKTWEWFND